MSTVQLINPNIGPLKLDHDPSPRDFNTEAIIHNRTKNRRNFRYHGYPEENFLKPKTGNKKNRKDLTSGEINLFDPGTTRKTNKPAVDMDKNNAESLNERQDKKMEDRMNNSIFSLNPNPSSDNLYFMDKGKYESEKLKRERKEAEEDIARYKIEQQRKLKEEQEEKKKEYERATNFYLWDTRTRGHGAPKGDGDHRKQKFVEEQLEKKEEKKDNSSLNESSGGAVEGLLYTPKTRLQKNPSIHFVDKENIPSALNEQLRYPENASQRYQYGRELVQQTQEKELFQQEEKIKELQREIDMLKSQDPYGKPGAGAPNKSKSDSFTDRAKGRDDEVIDTPRRRYPLESEGTYFPFGRPGAGAPVLDVDGNPITSFKNRIERNTSSADERRKARAARVYYQELKQEEMETKKARQEFENHMKAPIGEFATVIKEGQVGKPRRDPITGMLLNHHLPSSDVSKFRMNNQYKDVIEMRNYHDDLTKQADDRHRTRELNRLKEKQMSKQHYDVMDEYWGRYGGGAPKDPVERRKAVLDQTLYSPGRPVEYKRTNELYEPKVEKVERVEPKYVRSIVPSTYKNQYDYPSDKTKNYGPPYATS